MITPALRERVLLDLIRVLRSYLAKIQAMAHHGTASDLTDIEIIAERALGEIIPVIDQH